MAENNAIEMGGREFLEVERSVLVGELGKENADKVIEEANALTDALDPELQDIVDSAPDLDEEQ